MTLDFDLLEHLNSGAHPKPWSRNVEPTSDVRYRGNELQLRVDRPEDARMVLTLKTGWPEWDSVNAELIMYLRNNADELIRLARLGAQLELRAPEQAPLEHGSICPICKGTGDVMHGPFPLDQASFSFRAACAACKGLGHVIIQQETP